MAALYLSWTPEVFGTIWHVDATRGDDTHPGEAEAPFRTIMRAAKLVQPGDTVVVHSGVYFEHVKLERGGTGDAPITFRSAEGPANTIITGANRSIRTGKTVWETAEASSGLWRTPLAHEPATLVSDDLNLYRYPSLDELRRFVVNDVSLQKKPGPGPKHGWTWHDGFLYLRLHASGKYGSTDPHAHTIKVSPARGPGFRGDEIDSRERACFLLSTPGPSHVVLDGFTFESPGFCGVWIRQGSAVVRHCKFVGCRTGVRGWDRPEKKPRSLSDDVLVEGCEFSEHPTYDDVADIIAETTSRPAADRDTLARFFWWHRKGGAYSSEIGIVAAAGRRWTIRHNYVHDTFDGLSFMSLSWSEDCEVTGNRFERIVDNAIEAENHAQRLRVRDNTIVDCFEPFSYQPLDGPPWPADILFERNTVTFTRAGVELWGRENLGWRPGCCKIYVTAEPTEVPGGLVFRDNLIWFPTGRMLSMNQAACGLRGVRFENNAVASNGLGGGERGAPPEHVAFSGNQAMALSEDGAASLQKLVAGDGSLHENAVSLGIGGVDDQTGSLQIIDGTPAAKKGARIAR